MTRPRGRHRKEHNMKWSRAFWADLGERAITTAVYGVIAMLTADASGAISGNPRQWWVVVGLPTALAVLKAILANAGGKSGEPSASAIGVTSTRDGAPDA